MENINDSLQENIQALINGELNEANREALLRQAQSVPEVADELAFSQSLARALHFRDTLTASAVLGAVIAEEGFPPPPAPTTFSGRKWWTWLGTASLLAVLITGAYFVAENAGFFASESQKISRAAVQPLENVLFLPTDGQGLTDLQAGMAAYDARQYSEAARSLEVYLNRRPDNAARVYLGVAQLLSGRSADAIQPLSLAAQSQEPPIRESALWYLALAYLENDNPNAARQALESMPTDGIYGSQAQELLEKLK